VQRVRQLRVLGTFDSSRAQPGCLPRAMSPVGDARRSDSHAQRRVCRAASDRLRGGARPRRGPVS